MSSEPQISRIPTLDKLGASVPANLDPKSIASAWFQSFASYVTSGNINAILGLFVEDALWRDILSLTWDFRTFDGASKIRKFLHDRLPVAHLRSFKLREFIRFQQPSPDLAWIIAIFDFESDVGIASGVFRLVPTSSGEWKAHTMFTNLEDLKGFQEKIGPLRSHQAKPGIVWQEDRHREAAFKEKDPAVLIIGAGHCGLTLAARLKALDVSTLVIERNEKIGDNWRNRYDALCLHWPIWFDHMPYIPFPPTWPLYTPAPKLADWIESYAKSLELNVWTSSAVVKASQDANKKWIVTIKRKDGTERTLRVNHLVFATGTGDGFPRLPTFPGQSDFEGEIIHSSKYKRVNGYEGKKVTVVGAGNSAHDVASDLARHGVDVTMYQRSATFVMNLDKQWDLMGGALYSENSPPLDVADRLGASMPHILQENGMAQRSTKAILAGYKDVTDALNKVGFKTYGGIKDTGVLLLLKTKGGGHYFDIGACQLIIDGKIKVKHGGQISKYTKNGLRFDDGSELSADSVILATGLGDLKDPIRAVCGDEITKDVKPIWGLDEEGELRGVWRDLGVPGLWYMFGSLQMSRFHSKHVALQIKALEEGIFSSRYSLD